MSGYSLTLGSFIRNGDYPLEANYIFKSELELKDFYKDELRKTHLHKGLLKIVSLKDKQILYWAIEIEGELVLKPLISSDSLNNLLEDIRDLLTQLDDTTSDINDRIRKIIGTDDYSEFREGLDNLFSISNFILQLKEDLEQDSKELHALVGTDGDIISTLEELPYHNFIEVVQVLTKFFGEAYLDDFDTLKKVQDVIYKLYSLIENKTANLQTELDLTQVGVGLSGDGSYNADKETHYLKDATSVMNALKTLDGIIHDNSISVSKELGNQLLVKHDGIYYNVDVEYDSGILTFKVNDSILKVFNIGVTNLIEESRYDPTLETIIIVFRLVNGETETLKIPVGTLIREWGVDNSKPNNVVELNREIIAGGGADKLSADVRISNNPNNILQKDGNTLFVDGSPITNLDRGIVALNQQLTEETRRAQYAEDKLLSNIDDLTNRISSNYDADKSLTENVVAISTKLTDEIARAKEAEHAVEDLVKDEQNRAELKELDLQFLITTHQNNVYNKDEVNNKLDTLKDEILGTDLNEVFNSLQEVQSWMDEHGSEYPELVAEVNKKVSKDIFSQLAGKGVLTKYFQGNLTCSAFSTAFALNIRLGLLTYNEGGSISDDVISIEIPPASESKVGAMTPEHISRISDLERTIQAQQKTISELMIKILNLYRIVTP